MRKRMHIAFDLDGTLCYRSMEVYLRTVNDILELNILQECLSRLGKITSHVIDI